MAVMEKTKTPNVYKRGSRYVVVCRHKGNQHKSFHRTLSEAREAKGRRQAGERTPTTRQSFEDYAVAWLDGYAGRTSRGLSEPTRDAYRAAIEHRAVPFFRDYKLADVEPPDVRKFIASLEKQGLAPSSIRKEVAPLRALFATALEDGALRTNPALGVRVSGRRDDDGEDERAHAMTREELARLLAELPEQWRLFFELLAHSGLRISEAIGLTWADVVFGARPRLLVRRQRCRGQWRTLKSRAGRRDVPLSKGMAQRLWTAKRGHADTERCSRRAPARICRRRTCADACSNRRVSEPVCRGSAFIATGTLARPCCSRTARTSSK